MSNTLTAKDPAETLDYTISYDRLLVSGETIASSSWALSGSETASIGADEYAPTTTSTTATAWIIGGTAGEQALLTNTIHTSSTPPRIYERTITIDIADL